MDKEWSLDILYKGLEDKKYIEDKKRLNQLIEDINSFSETLAEANDEEKLLLSAIDYMEQFELLQASLSSYLSLRESVNTSDGKVVNELNMLEKQLSGVSKPFAIIKKWIAGIEAMDSYMDKHPKLKAYSFMINDIKQDANIS